MMTLKEAREDAGYTIAELAEASGVPFGTVATLESGAMSPSRGSSSVIALADVLGVPTHELLFQQRGSLSQLVAIDPEQPSGLTPYTLLGSLV